MRGIAAGWGRVRRKSPKQIAQILALRLGDAVGVSERDFPLYERDVFDSARAASLRPARGGPVRRVAWVIVPPGIGSGGHTTLFRMLHEAAAAGIENTLYFYDRYDGDFEVNLQRLREGWPWLDCAVSPIPAQLDGFDAYIASSWQTAHVIGARTRDAEGRRLYFVQDFEPWFYPRGTLAALAEDTYRFGFDNVALGDIVHKTLRRELGVDAHLVPFGQDTMNYRLEPGDGRRDGVAVFAKVGNDRRGYRLCILALREFQRRHPTQPIHVYGDTVREPDLRVINHGYLPPARLNELYNAVIAGLVLSFTNISLVPAELAAAGAVPVMNDDAAARELFANPRAIWAPPTPTGLAAALGRAVEAPDLGAQAREVAAWRGPSWDDTGAAFVDVLVGRAVHDPSVGNLF
jgi:hypothetical protein